MSLNSALSLDAPTERRRHLLLPVLAILLLSVAGLMVPFSGVAMGGSFAYRVSAGGYSAVAGPGGQMFLSDRNFSGGSVAGPFSGDIAGTTSDDLYRKHRWGMTGYAVPVYASGVYTVRLHFAEPVFSDRGRRVFDVTAEGSLRVNDLDVVAQVGRNKALVQQFDVTVKDGTLNLGFVAVVEDPFISGIEVLQAGTSTTTTAPPSTTTTTARPTTTTAPPSTTTTTAPPSTTTTVAPPNPGFPDATNTGVRPGTALAPRGSVTSSADGQVIANLDVSGSIQVRHNNVTIRNVRVRNPGGTAISTVNTTGLLVEDCELDGSGNPDSSSAIREHNYTMRRCNVHHFGEGPRINGGVVLEDNYFHDFLNFVSQGAHQDCVQVTSGYNITIRHNTCLIGVDGANAAIMIGSYQGGNILIENNLLGGGGYTAYCGGTNGYTDVRYLNNRFTTVYYPRAGYWGPFLYCNNATLSGNVWHDGPNANGPAT